MPHRHDAVLGLLAVCCIVAASCGSPSTTTTLGSQDGGTSPPSQDAGTSLPPTPDAGTLALCSSSCPMEIDKAICWHGTCLPTHVLEGPVAGYPFTLDPQGRGIRLSDAGVMFGHGAAMPFGYDPATGRFLDGYHSIPPACAPPSCALLNVAPAPREHLYAIGTTSGVNTTWYYLYDVPPDGGQPLQLDARSSPPMLDVAAGGYVCDHCYADTSRPAADQFFAANNVLYSFATGSYGSIIFASPQNGTPQRTLQLSGQTVAALAANASSLFILSQRGSAPPTTLSTTSLDLAAPLHVHDLPPMNVPGLAADNEYVYFGVPANQSESDNREGVMAMRLSNGQLETLGVLPYSTPRYAAAGSIYQIALAPNYLYIVFWNSGSLTTVWSALAK
jgi:hypothetical protein